MKFSELIARAADLIETRGRIPFRALQLEFELDAERVDALREELGFAYPQISEIDGRGFEWRG